MCWRGQELDVPQPKKRVRLSPEPPPVFFGEEVQHWGDECEDHHIRHDLFLRLKPPVDAVEALAQPTGCFCVPWKRLLRRRRAQGGASEQQQQPAEKKRNLGTRRWSSWRCSRKGEEKKEIKKEDKKVVEEKTQKENKEEG